MQSMGPKVLKWAPLLTALFFFIFFCNIFEIIPGVQMPATARIALPMFLAVFVWFVFNIAGMIEHGPIGYLKHSLIPPGVPVGLLPIIVPIEFVSNFLVRSAEHTSELQSLMRISYAVFCLKKKKNNNTH